MAENSQVTQHLQVSLVKRLFAAGSHKQAIETFIPLLEIYKNDNENPIMKEGLLYFYAASAALFLLAKKNNKALEDLKKITATDKASRVAEFVEACLDILAAKHADAVPLLKKVLENAPEFERAAQLLEDAEYAAAYGKLPEKQAIKQDKPAVKYNITPAELKTFRADLAEKSIEKTDLTLNEKKIKTLRAVIGNWEKNIPHHNLQGIGDKIEITSALELPFYRVIVNTQYESRRLFEGQKPYRGEDIPPKQITLSNAMPWIYKTSHYTDYQTHNEVFVINNSQEVHKCYTCNGVGRVTCHGCGGRGTVTCSSCGGKGFNSCSSCGGKGNNRCWSCNGSGSIQKSEYRNGVSYNVSAPCSSCGGKGSNTCNTCGGRGTVTCRTCGGGGSVTCYYCGGTGQLTCTTCDGEGKVVNYVAFNNDFTPGEQARNVPNVETPQAVIKGDDPYIYAKEVKALGDYKMENIFTMEDTALVEGVVFDIKYALLKNAAKDALNEALKELNEESVMLSQKLRFFSASVIKLDYTYGGKKYTMWFYDGDRTIYSASDPILDFVEESRVEVYAYINAKNFKEAWKLFNKIEKMIKDTKKLEKIREDIDTAHAAYAEKFYIAEDYLKALEIIRFLKKANEGSVNGEEWEKKIIFKLWQPYILGGVLAGLISVLYTYFLIAGKIEILGSEDINTFLLWEGIGGFLIAILTGAIFLEKIRTPVKRLLASFLPFFILMNGFMFTVTSYIYNKVRLDTYDLSKPLEQDALLSVEKKSSFMFKYYPEKDEATMVALSNIYEANATTEELKEKNFEMLKAFVLQYSSLPQAPLLKYRLAKLYTEDAAKKLPKNDADFDRERALLLFKEILVSGYFKEDVNTTEYIKTQVAALELKTARVAKKRRE